MCISDFVFLYHPHVYETVPSAQIGLGMLSVATYAKELGASVHVINAQAQTIDEALELIPQCRFLCFYGCLVDAKIISIIALEAKRRELCKWVIVGGPLGKSPMCLAGVNLVVDGPGEGLIAYLLHHPPSLLRDGKMVQIGLTGACCIDDYPFPDRTLVEGPLGGRIFVAGDDTEQSTTILMSRGCRHHCAFCSSANGPAPQNYSLERIEAELDHCVSLGIRNIRVSDDNLMDDPGRLEVICKLLRDRDIKWRGSLRVLPNNTELYRMMALSGCRELSFGVESGDQRVLTALRKGIKVVHNTAAVRNAKDAGIPVVRALMMMATPGETSETLELNKRWVMEAQPDMVSLKVFVPYPGTDIFENPGRYHCRLLHRGDYNNSSYRPDNSVPEANIELPGVMTAGELTKNFRSMRTWLESLGLENRG